MSNEQVKKGRGCFFYGCLTLVIILLVGAAGLYFGVRYAINKVVANYTDTVPMKLPALEAVSATELAALQDRVKNFKDALDAGKSAEPLVLEERDINALIAGSPDFARFKDSLHVSLVGDQIKGQVSLPLDTLGFSRFAGRYLNGAATLKASLENGVLIVTIESLNVKGNDVPEQIMSQLRKQNMAQEAYKDPKTAETMRKLETIQVQDGHLTIKAKEPR